MSTPHVDALVSRARRRVRTHRALWASGRALVVCGTGATLWVVASRVLLLPDLDVLVATVVFLVVGAAAGAGALGRIRPASAARAADHWLDTRDLFATAVELRGRDDALALRQLRVADETAAGTTRVPAPVPAPRLLVAGLVLLAIAAVGGLLPNPQDAERERRAAERAAVEEQQEALRDVAEELQASEDDRVSGLGDQLDAFADALDDATREEALAVLEQAQAALAEHLEDDLAGRRTALAGLSRELGREPLGDGADPGSQLESLADDLAAGEETSDELAERLAGLADALGGLPEVADGLAQAAGALAAGDGDAAARAVREAASALADAQGEVAGQEAIAGAASAVDDAVAALSDDRRVADGAASDGEGAGGGDGNGDGPGNGDGSGNGSGSGSGGGGGGSVGGEVSVDDGGAREGTGTGHATGGGNQPDSDLRTDTVYDPPPVAAEGEEARLPGDPDADDQQIDLTPQEGPGTRTPGLVPYTDVIGRYADEARRTVESGGYPPALRDAVREYFNRLGGGG